MAAGDLALSLILSATNAASPVIDEVVASVNAVQASVDSLTASFAALDAASGGVDGTMSSVGASAAGTNASLSTLNGNLANTDTTLSTVSASAGTADTALSGLSASASGSAASLTGLASADGDVAVGFSDMGAAASFADSQMALFAASTTAATTATSGMASSTAAAAMTMKGLEKAQKAAADSQLASLGGMQQIGAALAKIVLIGTAVAAILGVVAVKAAADFQSGLTTLVTGAGELQSNLEGDRQGILQLATDTGTSTNQLVAAMYMINSSGQKGSQALETLRMVAEGAKVGVASMADVANGATTIMTDYASQHVTAAQAVNTLIQAVKEGKSHMQDMANAMATVLPTASAVGVQLKDVAGAMATMTGEGTDAASAATYLKQMLIALEAPTSKGVAALKSIGLTSGQVASQMRTSLPGALEMITEALNKKFPGAASVANAEFHKVTAGTETLDQALANLSDKTSPAYVDALKNIAGGSRQMQGMLELTGAHMGVFRDNVNGITSAVNQGKGSIAGWTAVQQDFNFKLSQAGAAVQVLFIQLGTALLPVLGQLVGAVTPLITRFTAWVSNANNVKQTLTQLAPVLALVGGIVGGILVVAFYAWATATWAALAPLLAATAPILLIIAVAAALGAGLILLYQHFAAVRTVVDAIGGAFASLYHFFTQTDVGTALLIGALSALGVVLLVLAITALPAIIAGLWAWVVAAGAVAIANIVAFWPIYLAVAAIIVIVMLVVLAIRHWGEIAHWLQGVWAAVIGWFGGAWHTVVAAATSAWNGIKSALNAVITWISTAWHNVIGWLGGAWHTLAGLATSAWNAVKSAIIAVVNGIVNWLKTAWQNAVNAVVGAFQWLYNHNYYFKDLVDAIRNVVQSVISWLQTAWHNVTTFIVDQWNTLKADATNTWNTVKDAIMSVVGPVISWLNDQWHAQAATLDSIWHTLSGLASSVWNAISSFITNAVNSAVNFLRNAWTSAEGFLSGVWNSIKNAVVQAWNFIVAQFAAAWGRVSGPLNSLGSSIGGFFSNLAGQMLQFGKNLIQGLIDGINSMLGAVGNAASNVASKIVGFLGFHHSIFTPPKEGPASRADHWAPDFITGFSEGLMGGIPSINAAVHHLVEPMTPLGGGSAFAGKGYPTGGGQTTIIVQLPAPVRSDVYLDKDKVGHSVMDYQAKEIRRQGVRNK